MKRCNQCGLEKDGSDFSPDRRNSDGLQGRCRACRHANERTPQALARAKAWRQTDRGKALSRAAHKRYETSDKGHETIRSVNNKASKKYGHSPKGKVTSVRYHASIKGLASIERAALRRMHIL